MKKRLHMRRKLFAFLLMICIMMCSFNTVFATEVDNYSNYQEFLQSSESTEILEMSSSTYEYVKNILKQEAITIPADFDSIDYSRIIKVYVDTGIENIDTENKDTIIDLLNNSNYVWVVPFEIGAHNFQITFGKTGIISKSSNWEITQVSSGTVSPYDKFLTTIKQSYDYSDIVLIGGIPNFNMPVALAFDETQAIAWIDLGYSELSFDNLSVRAKYKNVENIYDYKTVLNAMKSTSSETTMVFNKLILCLVVIIVAVIFAVSYRAKSWAE